MSASSIRKLHDFLHKGKSLRYKKGETILRAEDIPSGVYLLTKGYVRCYSISQNGQDFTLIIYKPSDFFPMEWAINNLTNRYYYEAMTSVVVYRVMRENFLLFLRNNPNVLILLTKNMVTRMSGLFKRMEDLVFGTAHNKVASILILCAERFGIKHGSSIIILLPLTHKDIASLIGIARETVSIEINRLRKANIISYHKRLIVILSMRKLQKTTHSS